MTRHSLRPDALPPLPASQPGHRLASIWLTGLGRGFCVGLAFTSPYAVFLLNGLVH